MHKVIIVTTWTRQNIVLHQQLSHSNYKGTLNIWTVSNLIFEAHLNIQNISLIYSLYDDFHYSQCIKITQWLRRNIKHNKCPKFYLWGTHNLLSIHYLSLISSLSDNFYFSQLNTINNYHTVIANTKQKISKFMFWDYQIFIAYLQLYPLTNHSQISTNLVTLSKPIIVQKPHIFNVVWNKEYWVLV